MTKQAHSIDSFCKAHNICRGTLYNLWKIGKGPRRMNAGRRVLITNEAGAEWRREMEAEAAGDNPEGG